MGTGAVWEKNNNREGEPPKPPEAPRAGTIGRVRRAAFDLPSATCKLDYHFSHTLKAIAKRVGVILLRAGCTSSEPPLPPLGCAPWDWVARAGT